MQRRQTRNLAVMATAAISALGMAIVAAPVASAASAAPSGTVTLDSTLPRWLGQATKVTTVTPLQRQRLAASPDATAAAAPTQTVRVYLAPNGGIDALKAKVAALSNPTSASYGMFLTSAQYTAAYAPTAASVATVTAYLKQAGLTVAGVSAGNRYVTASGTPAVLGRAFGVTLGTYTHDGQTVTAPSSAAVLPAAVGAAVLTVTGLDTTKQAKTHDSITPDGRVATAPAVAPTADAPTPPPAAFVNAKPCNINYGNLLATYQADYSTPLPKFQGQTLPYVTCGYTGPSFRSAYEGDTALTGAGVTVAITDAYAWQYIASDANTYATNNGDGAYTKGQLTQSTPAAYTHQDECDPTGWSGEETLDVEAVHAMAPDAKIAYYASASCFDDDFLDTLARVVDDNKASLVSNSWSDLEGNESSASIAAYEQVFLQGAAQGISFLFSSGDSGDELASTGIKQVDYPASDPYATAAGGTSTGIAYGSQLFNTSWGTQSAKLSADGKSWGTPAFTSGGGGGYSSLFNRPSYQTYPLSKSTTGRGVPDVSMDADPNTGMLIGQTQQFPSGVSYGQYRIGGTSLASPLLAGFFALAVQGKGSGFGQLNPLLYSNKSLAAKTPLISDVRPSPANVGVVRVNYNNSVDPSAGLSYFVRTFGHDSSLGVWTGWDPSTGLGVPNTAFLGAYTPATTSTPTSGSGTTKAPTPGKNTAPAG